MTILTDRFREVLKGTVNGKEAPAMRHNELVGRALDFVKHGLEPVVRQKMRSAYDERWEQVGNSGVPNREIRFDVHALLDSMKKHWHQAFQSSLPLQIKNLLIKYTLLYHFEDRQVSKREERLKKTLRRRQNEQDNRGRHL